MIEPKKLPRARKAIRRRLRNTVQRFATRRNAPAETIHRMLSNQLVRTEFTDELSTRKERMLARTLAARKTKRVMAMVQATSLLELQGISSSAQRRIDLETTRQLLLGTFPSRKSTK